jgi:hypothetical protein
MSPINTQAIQQLRTSLSSTAVVLTPSSAGYKKSLERWASSVEKGPVSSGIPWRVRAYAFFSTHFAFYTWLILPGPRRFPNQL